MRIAGLQKFSLIDYAGQIAAIVFTQGCYFRCAYCHNPELVLPEKFTPLIDTDSILDFLQKRRDKLSAVVITGGEPTMQEDLPEFISQVKEMGYLVKLDSSGVRPEVLEKLFAVRLVDYMAMDIKAPLAKYTEITCRAIDTDKISRSVKLIMREVPDYEFRTTLVADQLTGEDVLQIGREIKGAKRYYLQRFVPTKTVDNAFMTRSPFADDTMQQLREKLLADVQECEIR